MYWMAKSRVYDISKPLKEIIDTLGLDYGQVESLDIRPDEAWIYVRKQAEDGGSRIHIYDFKISTEIDVKAADDDL